MINDYNGIVYRILYVFGCFFLFIGSNLIDAFAEINALCEPQCVNYVKNNLPKNSKWNDIEIGSAKNWWRIEDDPDNKGIVPRIKSIIVFDEWQNNDYGHVGIVVDIKRDSLLIEHSNWIFVEGEKCNISTNWFLLKYDKGGAISVSRNNKIYPVLGFIYAWDIQENKKRFSYKQIAIGKQLWMAENLNVSHYRNGDPIKHAITHKDWQEAWLNKEGAWCYVNNDPETERIFGRLYNWYAVSDSRGLAPKGWCIPTDYDWFGLEENIGLKGGYQGFIEGFGGLSRIRSKIAGYLKSKGYKYWKYPNKGANNMTGFSAMPTGYRYCLGSFFDQGESACFWSVTKGYADFVITRILTYDSQIINRQVFGVKGSGYSVRCIRE